VPDPRDCNLDQAVKAADALLQKRRKESPEKAPRTLSVLGSLPKRSEGLRSSPADSAALPRWVDLRPSGWLPPVEDQGQLGSCTAQAVVGLLETLARSLHAEWTDLSRLFLYKVTRSVLQWSGDTGAHIRSTIRAARLFGVPPEEFYPYDISRFDEEPSAFHYQYATNFKATVYGRLDTFDRAVEMSPGEQALRRLKETLSCGHTAAFGFPVFASIKTPSRYFGEVPYPRQSGDRRLGGHAVQAVGYNDELIVESRDGEARAGAVVIRNSWGPEWGDRGFGYIPYAYFEDGLAVDCWTVFNAEWINEKYF
jgi:C1A family cysteine protease